MLTQRQLKELRALPVEPNRVQAAMDLAGVTHVRVAAGVGSTQSHVTEVANGNYSRLPLETARAFAKFFGCAIEDLFPAREAVAS